MVDVGMVDVDMMVDIVADISDGMVDADMMDADMMDVDMMVDTDDMDCNSFDLWNTNQIKSNNQNSRYKNC